MTATPLDAELAGIAIIDGLERAERRAYLDTEKLEAVIRQASDSYLGPIYQCDSKYSYFDALDDLIVRANHGSYYLLHFECHGSPDGLRMGTDIVAWADQAARLAQLNNAMNGQLVIDLSACNGIYASKMAGLQQSSAPFYAVIGPAKQVDMKCAAVITAAFYTEFLGPSFGLLDQSIARANARLGLDVLKGLRAEVFLREQQAGYPFRSGAPDDDTVECLSNGTLRVR